MTVKRRCFGCRAVLCSGGEAVKKSVCIGILCVLVFGVSLGVGLKLGFMQTNAERYAELWKIRTRSAQYSVRPAVDDIRKYIMHPGIPISKHKSSPVDFKP